MGAADEYNANEDAALSDATGRLPPVERVESEVRTVLIIVFALVVATVIFGPWLLVALIAWLMGQPEPTRILSRHKRFLRSGFRF